MQQSSLLDLKINLTPEKFSHFLKEQGDVFWWERGKFWVITSYEYAKSVLTSPDYTCDRSAFFVSRMPNLDLNLITDFFAVVSKMMVMSDAPQHTARRRICYDGFSNQTLEQMHSFIHNTIDSCIDQSAKKGFIELVEDIAKPLPSTILADFFDIPLSDRQKFYDWSNNMTQFFGGSSQYRNEDGVEVNNSAGSLYRFFAELITKRRTDPRNDFLSTLLKHQQAFGLTDDEIISQAIMMLVAGQVTTTDQFCNNIHTLLTTKNALEMARSGDYDAQLVLDELNRLDPAVTFIFRVAKQDTQIGTQSIKAGDVIFISTHAVNRDARAFQNPDEFSLTRKSNLHMSYGFGPHFCLGAKLAQMEMKTCLTKLLGQFPNLRLKENETPKRKHHSLSFSGFERLSLQLA